MSAPGPESKRRSSYPPTSSSSNQFLIPENIRKKLKAQVKKKLHKAEIDEVGKVFEIEIENGKIYQVILVKMPQTSEISYFAFDSNDKELLLGKGGSGEVMLAQNIISGKLAAVKIQKDGIGIERELRRERRNLQKTESLIGVAQSEDKTHYTLMEYYHGLTLLQVLYDIDKKQPREQPARYPAKKDINLIKKLELVVLVLRATIWLHRDVKLAHRDMKPENLIFVENLRATYLRFVDFGSSIELSDELKEKVKEIAGTFGYIPPELLLHRDQRDFYDYPSDLFQLGVVMAEIMTNQNYQAALCRLSVDQASKNLEELSLDKIKELMPDVFSFVGIPDEDRIGEKFEVWKKVSSLIFLLCEKEPTLRPNILQLERAERELTALLKKMEVLYTTPVEKLAHYQELKRRNSSPLLPRSLDEKPSDSVSPRKIKLKHAQEFATARAMSQQFKDSVVEKREPSYLPGFDALLQPIQEKLELLSLEDLKETKVRSTSSAPRPSKTSKE